MQSFQTYYDAWRDAQKKARPRLLTTMQTLSQQRASGKITGFDRIETLRRALEAIDKQVFYSKSSTTAIRIPVRTGIEVEWQIDG